MRYYAASTSGFYDTDIHGDNIPADRVEVGDAEYDALFVAQAAGQRIAANADGYPVAVDAPQDDPKVAIQAQIDAIERETMTNRGARELHIGLIRRDGRAQGLIDDAAIAAKVPYFAKLIAIDAQVRALRAQL